MTPDSSPDPTSPLYNEDLAPVPESRRTWTVWNIAALWVGMAVCIPTYMLASGLIAGGMSWWQAILTVFLGNVIVLIPLTLNAFPGTKYGIPFPVLLRAPFGTTGSNIPALMRGLVACGWFGIQTWIGGTAIYAVAAEIFGFVPTTAIPSGGQLVCFFLFWCLNMAVIIKGMNCVKWLETLSAPFLLLLGVGMLIWAYVGADGFGELVRQGDQFETRAEFWGAFAVGLTGMVGFWATLSLNIPDFSRFARSQRDQIVGQAISLPTTMTFYAAIGVLVTSASVIIFGGEPIWNPVALMAKFENPVVMVVAMLALVVATLSTNIAANIVSPANDFSNLAPSKVSFRTGGLIAGTIGLFIFPWKILENAELYIGGWLIGYSALLGPIAGIMIADYFVVRKQALDVAALYDPKGEFGGFRWPGFAALALGVLPNLPGFLTLVTPLDAADIPAVFTSVYSYAWFVGFLVAFASYPILAKLKK